MGTSFLGYYNIALPFYQLGLRVQWVAGVDNDGNYRDEYLPTKTTRQ